MGKKIIIKNYINRQKCDAILKKTESALNANILQKNQNVWDLNNNKYLDIYFGVRQSDLDTQIHVDSTMNN